MNKPWFKFNSSDWLSGSIQLLSDGEKGTYIDLVAMIWKESGSLKLDKILSRKLRLDHATVCERIESYCELNIMVCESGVLSVKFISDQIEDLSKVSIKNAESANKRWAKKDKPMRPNANKKREEEIREDKKEIREDNKTIQKRSEDFQKQVADVWKESHKDMSKEMVRDFFDYWVEHGVNDTKLRFEKEKTFGLSRRMASWKKNNFNGNQNQPQEPNIFLTPSK